MNERIIFLDFDGVIRIAVEGGWISASQCEFNPSIMKRVRDCCRAVNAKIVISSDWRGPEELKTVLSHIGDHLGEFLHEDWMTPIKGWRWQEVTHWLKEHPSVFEYAILEDSRVHFENCPPEMAQQIVWCNNRYGFVPSLAGVLISKFKPTTPNE